MDNPFRCVGKFMLGDKVRHYPTSIHPHPMVLYVRDYDKETRRYVLGIMPPHAPSEPIVMRCPSCGSSKPSSWWPLDYCYYDEPEDGLELVERAIPAQDPKDMCHMEFDFSFLDER